MIDYTEIDKRLAAAGYYRARADVPGWSLRERTNDGESVTLWVTDDKRDAEVSKQMRLFRYTAIKSDGTYCGVAAQSAAEACENWREAELDPLAGVDALSEREIMVTAYVYPLSRRIVAADGINERVEVASEGDDDVDAIAVCSELGYGPESHALVAVFAKRIKAAREAAGAIK